MGSKGSRLLVLSCTVVVAAGFLLNARLAPLDGRGKITGRVVTTDGQPVAGAIVRAVQVGRWGRRFPDDPPEIPTLEQHLRDAEKNWRLGHETGRTATTGEDGRYVLAGLLDAPYMIDAWAAGYDLDPVRYRCYGPGGRADFVSSPVVRLPVTVIAPEGRSLFGVQLVFRRGYATELARWDPRIGTVVAPVGTWRVVALSEVCDLESDAVAVTLTPGVEPAPIMLTLHPRRVIRGTVRGLEAMVGEGVTVKAVRLLPGADPDPALLLDRIRVRRERARPCHDCAFEFTDVEPGSWLVGVEFYRERRVVVWKVVEVAEGPAVCELVIPPPPPEESVEVVVETADGAAPVNALFQGWWEGDPDPSTGTPLRAAREADGRWQVWWPRRPSWLAAGAMCIVEVSSAGHGRAWARFDPTAMKPVHVRLTEPAVLDLTLDGFADTRHRDLTRIRIDPVVGGQVLRLPYHDRDWPPLRGDIEGGLLFGPICSGPYEMSAVLDDGRKTVFFKETVSLVPGMNRRSISLPALGSLTVLTPTLPSGVRLHVTGPAGSRFSPVVSGNVANVPLLVHGEYEVSYKDARWEGRQTVRVTGDKKFGLEITRIRWGLRVDVCESGNAFHAAGLRAGDRLIGVNGEEFGNRNDLDRKMSAVTRASRCWLLVLRGSERLDLELPDVPIADPRAHTILFTPVRR